MIRILISVLSIIIILLFIFISVSSVANIIFDRTVTSEIKNLLSKNTGKNSETIQKSDIDRLPLCVQKFLENSGIIGKELIKTVRLKQKISMRLKSDARWANGTAEQYFTVLEPAFIWKARISIAPLIDITARDMYNDGHGNMKIYFQSLIPIADSKGSEIDQGSMVRFLAEIIWFPTATLSDYIHWEQIDTTSARIFINYGETTVSGIFKFNNEGDIISFEAKRFGEFDGKYSLETWFIKITDYKSFSGIRIPYKSEVTWKLASGDYTWLKLEITDMEYNASFPY